MNFRANTCPDTGEFLLNFGFVAEIRFDDLGTITEVAARGGDRQLRHKAQRLARDAAARARTQLGHGTFGRRDSAKRRHFIELVARIANDMEAALNG